MDFIIQMSDNYIFLKMSLQKSIYSVDELSTNYYSAKLIKG